MAEDAICLLDYIGWTKERDIHVVGISLGGMIAQGALLPTTLSIQTLTGTSSFSIDRAGDSYTRTHYLAISCCHDTWWRFIIESASGMFMVPVHFSPGIILGYSFGWFPSYCSGRAPRLSLGTYEVPHPHICGAPPNEAAASVVPSFTSVVRNSDGYEQISYPNSLLILISSPAL